MCMHYMRVYIQIILYIYIYLISLSLSDDDLPRAPGMPLLLGLHFLWNVGSGAVLELLLTYPEDPSTQYSRPLVPKPGDLGPESLNIGYLDPLGTASIA